MSKRSLLTLLTAIVIPIILLYLWEEIRPSYLRGYFESNNIQIPMCLLSPNSKGYVDRQLVSIELKNNRDEDVLLKSLRFDSIKDYQALNISFPQKHLLSSRNDGSYQVDYSNNIVTMTGNVVIPAGLGIIVYLWGEKVSPWPRITAITNRGEIKVVWQPHLNGKFQLLVWEHIHWLITLLAILNVSAVIYFTRRKRGR